MFIKPQSIRCLVLSLILVLFVIQGVFAQSDVSSWQNLKLGPYPVGFKTIEKYDYSRTFRSKHDYFGNPVEGERARPIQIGIWYPAKEMKNLEVMVYGEYAFAYPEDESFINVLTNMQERENRFLFSINENNPGPVLDLMSINVNAVKDAPEKEGSFPLIIYCPSLRGNISENAQLCEFIASNGFVVATSHSMGATGLNPEVNQTDLEALVRDKEFVIANMHSQPNVNINKIGVIGFAAGGMTALIMQMRNTDIDAVVSINGTFINSNYTELLTNNPFYQSDRIQSPHLIVYTSEITTLDFSLVDGFKYSNRYLLELCSLQHFIFSHHGITPISSQQAETDYYEIPLNFVNNFLKAELDSDNNSMEFLKNSVSKQVSDDNSFAFRTQPGEDIPPNSQQFYSIIQNVGMEKARELCGKFNLLSPEQPILAERVIQDQGYRFLRTGQTPNAIELFKMGTEAYPNSANSWDCLAEAYMASRNNEMAIKYYKKTLEVLPNDTTTSGELKNIIRTNTPEILQRLEQQN